MKRSLFIIRYRWLIIILTGLLIAGSIIPLFKLKINPDLESYLPDSMESKINNQKISDVFGNDETILIFFETDDILNPETLNRIRNIGDALKTHQEFGQVFSVFETKNIRSEDGMMVVDPVIRKIPENKTEKEKLREEIKSNDLAYGLVVSPDFHYTMIMLTSTQKNNDSALMSLIKNTIQAYPGKEKTYITGQPFLRDEANNKIGRDIMILLPIGLIVMLIFLWISFREIKAVLLPFSVVIISILTAMALIPLFGWELSLIGVLIPIMMIAIANNYGVHFVAKYQELNTIYPERKANKIIHEAIEYLKKPVILCGLTTIVGTLGLVAHLLLPARQMGVISSIAIGFSLLLSLTYIPAMMSLLKKDGKNQKTQKVHDGFFHKTLSRLGDTLVNHPRLNILIFSSFFIIASLGIFRMHVAPDSNKVLPGNHEFNQGIQIADDHFGGSKMINIMFTGDATDPKLLKRIDHYSDEMGKNPLIGKTTSLATMIKKMSMALNDPQDSGYNAIPNTSEAISQYLELYAMSADIADFEQFVNFDYTNTLLSVQYRSNSLQQTDSVINDIKNIMKDEPGTYTIGGFSLVDKELSESVKTGQYYSLLVAFVAILILLSLIFKSFTAGLIGSLPLVFAVFCTFGIMGWAGIELNLVTALLSSISIGLGVDFTIHVFWRLKYELQQKQNNWKEAIRATIPGIGRGISINALSVMMGFSVLFLSAFPLIISFGLLIIISLLLCLVSALLFIPALCLAIKPRFLTRQ